MSFNWNLQKEYFLKALMDGDTSAGLVVSARVTSAEQLGQFYRYVIQPSLYDIGEAWAQGKLSVSQEHLASAIVGRVLSSLNARFCHPLCTKGRVVVSTIYGEYHELGAWILADLLEHDGWEVCYLGANPADTRIFDTIVRFKPHLLALSVTMPTNIDYVRRIIVHIRQSAIWLHHLPFLLVVPQLIHNQVSGETLEHTGIQKMLRRPLCIHDLCGKVCRVQGDCNSLP